MRQPRRKLSAFWVVGSSVMLVAVGVLGACGANDGIGRHNLPAPIQDVAPVLVPANGELVFVDRETGSLFNLRGEAFAGPLAAQGLVLEQLPGISMFWFAWSVFFPGADVWGRDQRVRDATLATDKTGTPGCPEGRDCIPSLPHTGRPSGALAWTEPADASYLEDSDLVLGTFVARRARAYPHNVLWWHEIANDRIGDRAYSVSFCPLTGSGVVWGGNGDMESFGVSGNLFNSNLVMYDHHSRSMWSQLYLGSASRREQTAWLNILPVTETTWGRWKQMHPQTLVLSDDTGFKRDYDQYPYAAYRTNHRDTFLPTHPAPDPMYQNKEMVFGLVDRAAGISRAYVHADLQANAGARAIVNDSFAGKPVVIVHEQAAQLVVAFSALGPDGGSLTFDAVDFSR